MVANQSSAVVAEGQDFFNAGLAALLRHDMGFAAVAQARHHAELTRILAAERQVDFLALDIDLPGAAGTGTIRDLHARRPAMRIAVLSDRTDPQNVLDVLAAGANGFIPKQVGSCAELLQALRSVRDTGIFVPANLVASTAGSNLTDDTEPLSTLTVRQREVLRLLSQGHSNKMIARKLGISPSTVKVHVHAAFQALGVHTRVAAMAALRPLGGAPLNAAPFLARRADSNIRSALPEHQESFLERI
ncbi:DNA-binding response regulator [Sphingomonas ginkgonis]|uniref:DNA-binding response regulator n=1 Tax=Sphingomonas ginkgonis TaxID=2315330 RepID=A0A429VC22_9SPHN|nr:response regulator transcription factor [Sphingomonas ginkgonis]RST31436.1 DNA-binding response regulator [Sphingomonas ginkgonis]